MAKGGARYVGDGDYVPGIPARDLSAAEWKKISETVREQLVEAGLYRPVSSKSKASGVNDGGE